MNLFTSKRSVEHLYMCKERIFIIVFNVNLAFKREEQKNNGRAKRTSTESVIKV